MQRLSALVRYIFTVILVPILIAVAIHFIEKQPQETANVVLKFLFDLSDQTWFRVTALSLGCFVAGLWVDWLLRKLSSANERRALGTKMLSLDHDLSFPQGPIPIIMLRAHPQSVSCFTAAKKFRIWVPDNRIFSINPDRARGLITDYLGHVGTMLEDGHFSEAKHYAKSSKASFDEVYAGFGLSSA
jgi:hypothetical protein